VFTKYVKLIHPPQTKNLIMATLTMVIGHSFFTYQFRMFADYLYIAEWIEKIMVGSIKIQMEIRKDGYCTKVYVNLSKWKKTILQY